MRATVRANDRATRENRFPPSEIARNAIYFLFVGYLQTVGDLAPADFEPSNVRRMRDNCVERYWDILEIRGIVSGTRNRNFSMLENNSSFNCEVRKELSRIRQLKLLYTGCAVNSNTIGKIVILRKKKNKSKM